MSSDEFTTRVRTLVTSYDLEARTHQPRFGSSAPASVEMHQFINGVLNLSIWGLGFMWSFPATAVLYHQYVSPAADGIQGQATHVAASILVAPLGAVAFSAALIGMNAIYAWGRRQIRRLRFGPSESEMYQAYGARLRARGYAFSREPLRFRPPSAKTIDGVIRRIRPHVGEGTVIEPSTAGLVEVVSAHRLFDQFPLIDLLSLRPYSPLGERCNSLLTDSSPAGPRGS